LTISTFSLLVLLMLMVLILGLQFQTRQIDRKINQLTQLMGSETEREPLELESVAS
jgi:hypothetical protein